ncbi:transmembrane protein 41A-like [Dysidea avara]|uniref:transmembrane protein 41A-like n=1 Tax=Dysidea avara TaxID=196820 RepID=UPI003323EB73
MVGQQLHQSTTSISLVRSIAGLVVTFTIASAVLYYLLSLVARQLSMRASALFPTNVDQLKELTVALDDVKDERFGLILSSFCAVYIFKQSFAIPGSVLTNILGGALFGMWLGFPLVCLLSASGSTCCYLLSRTFGKHIVLRYQQERIKKLEDLMLESQSSLVFFLLSLRLFPVTPNWLLNMASPIVGVPILPFFISVFIGLMPYNFICVHAGLVISNLKSTAELFEVSTILKLIALSLLMVTPGIVLKIQKSKRR